MSAKAKIGAIVEIKTKLGNAYAQFSHYHEAPPRYGALLRVLPGIFGKRPNDFKDLVGFKESFVIFFPLQAALNRRIVELVAQEPVPLYARAFPIFRDGISNPATGKVAQWWLWDGTREWKVEKLTDEQLDWPIRQICNDIALIQMIESGWTPRKAEALMQAARLKNSIQKRPTASKIRHFLLFKNSIQAERAKLLSNSAGFTSDIIDTGSGFSLRVEQSAPFSEEYIEHMTVRLTEIAREVGGTYDAWETLLA
jgi:hypothetical protein